MKDSKEAKVLVISSSFNAGNAITVLNLFKKWNRSSMFCVTMSKLSFHHIDNFSSIYFLGTKERYSSLPFSRLLRIEDSCVLNNGDLFNPSKAKTQTKPSFARLIYDRLINPLLMFFGYYDRRFKYKISKDLIKWIKEIKPDYFYSHVGSYGLAEFSLKLQKEFPEIKFITHCWDDWSNRNSYSKNIFKRYRDLKANSLLSEIIKNSSICIAATDLMVKDFEKKYNRKFECFYNPAKISNSQLKKETKKRELQITYIGKIALHNKDAIIDMMKAVEIVNKKLGVSVKLNIYTQIQEKDFKRSLPKTDYTFFYEPLPHDKILEVLKESSFLFLPITISKKNISFTKYSFSTKISEYLASNVPIIYYGPKEIAMSDVFIDSDCAFTLTERSQKKLIELILSSISNNNEIEKIVQNAFNLARNKYDVDIVSNKFYKKINQNI